jgi:hypothetical protein
MKLTRVVAAAGVGLAFACVAGSGTTAQATANARSTTSSAPPPPPPVPHGHYVRNGHEEGCVLTNVRPVVYPNVASPPRLHVRTGLNRAWVLFLPGANSYACHPTRTRLSARAAKQLVHDVNTAPMVGPGTFACPNDDGTRARLVFDYRSKPNRQVVEVSLAGCQFMNSPRYRGAWLTSKVRHDIAPELPPNLRR